MIYELAALNRLSQHRNLFNAFLAGKVREVFSKIQQEWDCKVGVKLVGARDDHAMLVGDLALALGHGEEAEEAYQLAIKEAAKKQSGHARIASSRATGMLSLFRRRFGIAEMSFRRVTEDDIATDLQRVEAYCGQAMAKIGIGLPAHALHFLDLADNKASSCGSDSARMMVALLRIKLLAHLELLSHTAFDDHIFRFQSIDRRCMPTAGWYIKEMSTSYFGEYPLVRTHLDQSLGLIQAANGDARAIKQITNSQQWLHQIGMLESERKASCEMVLASIALENMDCLKSMRDSLIRNGAHGPLSLDSIERHYCLSKIYSILGCSELALNHYRHYTKQSIERLNSARMADHSCNMIASDDVTINLPPKYRSAYQYIIEHLTAPTLGVKEIAENIGVTNRSIQLAFKTRLGLTPMQVVQRARVQRVRDLLLSGDAPHLTIMQAAERYGIRNRSSFSVAYQKFCHETPAQTISSRTNSFRA